MSNKPRPDDGLTDAQREILDALWAPRPPQECGWRPVVPDTRNRAQRRRDRRGGR